jgi:hypothetical protein
MPGRRRDPVTSCRGLRDNGARAATAVATTRAKRTGWGAAQTDVSTFLQVTGIAVSAMRLRVRIDLKTCALVDQLAEGVGFRKGRTLPAEVPGQRPLCSLERDRWQQPRQQRHLPRAKVRPHARRRPNAGCSVGSPSQSTGRTRATVRIAAQRPLPTCRRSYVVTHTDR